MNFDAASQKFDELARRIEVGADNRVKAISRAVLSELVSSTPVDTGAAISNWTATVDAPSFGARAAHVPGEGGSTALANSAATLAEGTRAIGKFNTKRNRRLFIQNRLPYIGRLNDGHSPQAPAGFVLSAVRAAIRTVRGTSILSTSSRDDAS